MGLPVNVPWEYCGQGLHPMEGDNVRLIKRKHRKTGKAIIERACAPCANRRENAWKTRTGYKRRKKT